MIRYILPIAMISSVVFITEICKPSTIEAWPYEARQVFSKFMDCDFKAGEFIFQNLYDLNLVSGPLRWSWIKTFKFGTDRIMKLSGCNEILSNSINSEPQDRGGHEAYDDTRPCWESNKDFNEFFFHFMYMLLLSGILGALRSSNKHYAAVCITTSL